MEKLKNVVFTVLGLIVFFVVPFLGFAFLAVMLVAGGVAWYNMEMNMILDIGWKIYLGGVVFTLFFNITFSFLQCCVDLNGFRHHLLHHRSQCFDATLAAFCWPWTWYTVHAGLMGWGMSWLNVVFDSLKYWFITRWKGIKITMISFK